jgi:hypothetical protein
VARLRHKAHAVAHVVCHKGEHLFHSLYLGMVSVEAHGYYRYAAGAALVVIMLDFFMHLGAPEA